MKNSQFSSWLRNIWLDNCEEHQTHGEQKYTMAEYWNKYKWWLRREYRHKISKENT